MLKKIFAFSLVALVLLNAVAFADVKKGKTKAAQTNQLAALLPASDGVLTVNSQRLLNEAAPQILAASPEKLNEFNDAVEDVKKKTGLDLRQFEQIAVGVNFKQNQVDPLMLARGKYDSSGLLAAVKAATGGKYREEKIGARTIYVFSTGELASQHQAKISGNSVISKIFNAVVRNIPEELAVTTFDEKTLALGSVARLREIFETKTRVSAEILSLVSRKPNALMNFGANTPEGLARFVELGDDEIGETLASVRQISGMMDLTAGNAVVSVKAKTIDAAQAESLEGTLVTLQALGKGFLGGMSGNDKKVYARMLEKLKITRAGTQIGLDLQVPQSDIDILLGAR
mgnify:CR=1 FL=1|jgi:Pyruvate dehydrogenase complex, dehydrogenase (E1) component